MQQVADRPSFAVTAISGSPVLGLRGWLYAAGALATGWLVLVSCQPDFLPAESGLQMLKWLVWAGFVIGLVWLAARAWPLVPAFAAPFDDDEDVNLPVSFEPREERVPPPSPIWQRYGQDMLDPLRMDPAAAGSLGLDWQGCIDRLHDLRHNWQAAQAVRVGRALRLLWLETVLQLFDRGVVRALHDGTLPDVAALRTERLLLEADQGPGVLTEVPALFARRIRFALETMSTATRADALAQWQLFADLQVLAVQERRLEARSQVVLALAWNDQVDLDQVEVGYALAEEYRAEMAQWLQHAAGIRLASGTTRLDAFLLARCDASVQEDSLDAIGYVEAMRALHAGMLSLLYATLARLVVLADAVERSQLLVLPQGDQDFAT